MSPQSSRSSQTPDLPDRISRWQTTFNAQLEARLQAHQGAPEKLVAAMRYAGLDGGKRIRPLLVYATGAALEVPCEPLHAIACAIEIIHTYSLIHDDLPAMDDDDLRRGRPTCHRAFDEATAILAGDALQALAFGILATDPALCGQPSGQIAVIGSLAEACGAAGMAGGQVLDLAAVNQQIDLQQLETMHRLKTGALIRVSATAAADFAGVKPQWRGKLSRYGELVGLAFQIHDDMLDVTASSTQTGKPARSDAARNKPAYPSVLGMEASGNRARELRDSAVAELEGLPGDISALRWLAGYAIDRES